MFAMDLPEDVRLKRQASAFTLAEVVISVAVVGLIFGGILTANVQSAKRAEWSGYSLAAQALAIQQLEQSRASVWDDAVNKNELTNLNLLAWTYNTSTRVGKGYSWTNLDLPISGTNFIRATNFVTVSMLTNVTGVSGVKLQMVQVDTVWHFRFFGGFYLCTNTIVTYFAPDNRDPSTL
jgi:type II secretory pathway pseudopilin PulG